MAEGQKKPPAQFHEPSETELKQASILLSDAISVFRNDPARAENSLRQAMHLLETSWGPEHPDTAGRLFVMSHVMARNLWFDAAEEVGRRAIGIDENYYGIFGKNTVRDIGNLAYVYEYNYQPELAEKLYRAAFELSSTNGKDFLELSYYLEHIGSSISAQGRYAEAQQYLDKSLEMRIELEGGQSNIAAVSRSAIGENLFNRGNYSGAKSVLVRADSTPRGQPNTPPWMFARIRTVLGRSELALGEIDAARSYLSDAVNLSRAVTKDTGLFDSTPFVSLSKIERKRGNFESAISLLRESCLTPNSMKTDRSEQRSIANCYQEKVLSLFEAQNSLARRNTLVDDLRTEAFESAQFSELFESGYALARYGARIEATARGAGSEVLSYDEDLRRYNKLQTDYVESFAYPASRGLRLGLQRQLESVRASIIGHKRQIRLRSPLYWELQSPASIKLESLQARAGNEAKLLNPDEALVVFVIPPGADRGVVFAISKTRFEWAQTPFSGADIAKIVSQLRNQIDRKAYDVGGATGQARPFDRQAAYELYRALFGNARIAEVIGEKKSLLIVPSGPLASLPPGLLITAPPPGGPTQDADPSSLRSTRWLLRDKAITVLPAVASLRTLRQLLPQRQVSKDPADRLIAFADPDFSGIEFGYPSSPQIDMTGPTDRARARSVETYFRGDRPIAEALRTLGRLEGTSKEVEAVRQGLNAPRKSLNLWGQASETQLRRLQSSGELSRAQVIEFATHGLIAGNLSGLGQPALALSAPAPNSDPALDDGLLTAAEAATLQLNANWVILSACNSAAPDSPNAQGLSGLARGFFYAGARSLLISHWRVRDDVAPILIPDILARLASGRATTKAEALRQASLAILDDQTRSDFANPFSWAPFVLVGETLP